MSDASADRATLVAFLAHHFGLLTDDDLTALFAGGAPTGPSLVGRGVSEDVQHELAPLADLLLLRHADREVAGWVIESGHASEDEIDFAFGGQEQAWRRDRSLRAVGDLLVEFGSIDDAMRDSLHQRQGR
ncbi:MAG: hypothetical protein H6704_23490 [Myxococcales bacterium]|nr:hypothetical protein [Myxococcales bacterium]